MPLLSLHLFGPFRATLGGVPIRSFESNKVRALLAYLVVENNRPHSREVLAEILWPEQPQRLALDNLRFVLSDLRKAIQDPTAQPPFLIISRETIRFNPDSDFWLDVAEFERQFSLNAPQKRDNNQISLDNLRNAIALYQGGFMEGFTASRSAPFEEWIALKRERFARQAAKSLQTLADTCERQGENEQAMLWQEVESLLESVLNGVVDVGDLVRRRRRPVSTTRPPSRKPPRVLISNTESEFYTLVDVIADDRIGLLYDVTRTLGEQGVEIFISKAATIKDQVTDAFYVKDEEGKKIKDPMLLERLRNALLEAVRGGVAGAGRG